MDHDNIITMCYIDPNQFAHDHPNAAYIRSFNAEFQQSILSQCRGKQTCNAFVPNSITRIRARYQETYMYMFAQVSCVQSEEMLMTKNMWGLLVACLGCAICLIWVSAMNYLLKMDKINDKLYDMELVTVSDYAIMGHLPKSMYENFRRRLAQSQLYNGQTLYQMLHNQKRKVDTRPIILFKKELEDAIQ